MPTLEANLLIKIELVFASEEKQRLLSFEVANGTTAREAVAASDLVAEFPDFDFSIGPLGIWGKTIDDRQCLKEGDRLEVYRSLLRDPRDARRKLALQGRSMSQRDESGEDV